MIIRKNNKKALSFKLFFFAMVAMGILVSALSTWVVEWNTDYSSGITYDLDEFNKLDDVQGEVTDMKDGVTVKSPSLGEEFESTSIRGVYGILNNIFNPFRLAYSLIDSVAERWGLPTYLVQGMVLLIIVSIIMALVAIFFRLNKRNP